MEPRAKVALFAGCLVNYQATDVGKAVVQVFEKNSVEVVMPDQQCCGMPSFDLGDAGAIIRAAQANLRFLQPWLDEGYDIVTPLPSCTCGVAPLRPTAVGDTECLVTGR